MIKIELTKKQITEAQEKHWDYFISQNSLNRIQNKIDHPQTPKVVKRFLKYIRDDNDKILKKIIAGSPDILLDETDKIVNKFDFLFGYNRRKQELQNLKILRSEIPNQNQCKGSDQQQILEDLKKAVEKSQCNTLINDQNLKNINVCLDYQKKLKKNEFSRRKILEKWNSRLTPNDTKKKSILDSYFSHIQELFSYTEFSDTDNEWNAYEWVDFLNLKTCPYCNRQFIHIYLDNEDGETKTMRPDLDHYFPKSCYPFLGISLFNLIPSCSMCNSRFKGRIDFFTIPHINPFDENFGKNGKFRTNFEKRSNGDYDIDYLTSISSNNNFKLQLEVKNNEEKEKIDNSNNTFKLDGLYKNHKDYAHGIIKKTLMYNKSKIEELMEIYEGNLFSSKEQLMETIMGNYLTPEKQGEHVLAKLTQDIFDEFKIEEIWDEAVKKN